MLAILSPAKKLDYETDPNKSVHSQPDLLDQAEELVKEAKKLKPANLKAMMKISDNLADLNHQRFQDFSTPFTLANAKQAGFAFKGDAYVGLDIETLSDDDLAYAQDHFRILSGLYGLLRPMDLMQAYRLEMGTKFANKRGKDLYSFWDSRVTDAVNDLLAKQKEPVLVNLASNEYYKVLQPKNIKGKIITCQFKEIKDGQTRMIGVFAKKARGMMTRYIIQNRVETPDGLKGFKSEGYEFREDLSNDNTYVFTRPQP